MDKEGTLAMFDETLDLVELPSGQSEPAPMSPASTVVYEDGHGDLDWPVCFHMALPLRGVCSGMHKFTETFDGNATEDNNVLVIL